MTYIELIQRMIEECGISGRPPSKLADIATTGEMRRVANWIATAHRELQTLHNDWNWMRGHFTLPTTNGTAVYSSSDCSPSIASRFSYWDLNSIVVDRGAAGKYDVRFIPYEDWRKSYALYSTIAIGQPTVFTVYPDKTIKFFPTPNNTYSVIGDYIKTPLDLELDADAPEFPEEYHLAVVYGAMRKYARFEAAAEIYKDADSNYSALLEEMSRTQRPVVMVGGALA